jgi:dTDP-4-amino-4,6-dideoxygalactose transaminase
MPVHYAGQGCDMDAINIIAKKYGLFVVEDAAQGVGATWDGKPLGTLSDIGCFSFHSTKNIVCGEGGAFITNNIELAHKAEIIREKGTNRSAFLRGEVDKYTWVGLGSSYVLSDVLAAILKTQLLQVDDLNGRRVQIWNKYYEGTADLEAAGYVQRPYFHPKASNNGHIFALLIKNGLRNELMAQLKKLGVNCTFHYIPLHSSPFMVEYFKGNILDLPVTDEVSSSLLRLPLYPHLSEEDVEYVLSSFRDIFYRL